MTYHGGPDDVDKWLLTPIVRVFRLLECMKEDSEEVKKTIGKGSSQSPDDIMLDRMRKQMMKKREKDFEKLHEQVTESEDK